MTILKKENLSSNLFIVDISALDASKLITDNNNAMRLFLKKNSTMLFVNNYSYTSKLRLTIILLNKSDGGVPSCDFMYKNLS